MIAPALILLMGAASAPVASTDRAWAIAGVDTISASLAGATATTYQWRDGGTNISGATSATYSPSGSFGSSSVTCLINGLYETAPVRVLNWWVDGSGGITATAAGATTLNTTFAARTGQVFLVGAHLIGGSTLTGLTIGGQTPTLIADSGNLGSSRYCRWWATAAVTGANPVVSWSAGQSSTVVGVYQATGVGLTLQETFDAALDAATANTAVAVTLDSRQGLVLGLASRMSVLTGLTTGTAVSNVIALGGAMSALTTGLTVSAVRASGTQADRMTSAIRLAA